MVMMIIGVLMMFLWIKFGRPTRGRHSAHFISLPSILWLFVSVALIIVGYVVLAVE